MADEARILWFDAVGSADVKRVGGKNASLGEMIGALKSEGARSWTGLPRRPRRTGTMSAQMGSSRSCGHNLRLSRPAKHPSRRRNPPHVLAGEFPGDPQRRSGILPGAVTPLRPSDGRSCCSSQQRHGRGSAAGELRRAAGDLLNVRGERDLLDACRRCYASLFTDRAISYRETMGFDHLQVALSIGVQRMVRADRAGSGVMFSIDTETGFPKVVVISAAWGLGETVVQGTVNPDKYLVFKPLLAE